MPSASGRLVIYRWETDASVTSPDGVTLVGSLTEGQMDYFGGYLVKFNWIHFSGVACMISVGGDVPFYTVYYWPYSLPSSVDNQIQVLVSSVVVFFCSRNTTKGKLPTVLRVDRKLQRGKRSSPFLELRV